MTDTIGKIEALSQGLTVHIKAIEAMFCQKYVENLAKWLCRQDGKPEIGEDGSPQWWEYLMTARQILGVGNG